MSNTGCAVRVVPAPRIAFVPTIRSLRADIAEVSALLHKHVPGLSDRERQFLKDMKDEHRGSPMSPLVKLADISARADDPAIRAALPEAIHGYIARRVGRVIVQGDDVWDSEEHANSHANIALRRFNKYPTEANRRAARDAFAAQKAHSQQCIDLLDALYADKAVQA